MEGGTSSAGRSRISSTGDSSLPLRIEDIRFSGFDPPRAGEAFLPDSISEATGADTGDASLCAEGVARPSCVAVPSAATTAASWCENRPWARFLPFTEGRLSDDVIFTPPVNPHIKTVNARTMRRRAATPRHRAKNSIRFRRDRRRRGTISNAPSRYRRRRARPPSHTPYTTRHLRSSKPHP